MTPSWGSSNLSSQPGLLCSQPIPGLRWVLPSCQQPTPLPQMATLRSPAHRAFPPSLRTCRDLTWGLPEQGLGRQPGQCSSEPSSMCCVGSPQPAGLCGVHWVMHRDEGAGQGVWDGRGSGLGPQGESGIFRDCDFSLA